MPSVSVIISTSNCISTQHINATIEELRKQSIDLTIIVSNFGLRTDRPNCDKYIDFYVDSEFNLSATRNQGALLCNTEWLIFSDVDIIYGYNSFNGIVSSGHKAVRGNRLSDIDRIGSQPSHQYECMFAPFAIKHDLFEEIGRFSEIYYGHGLEDSDMDWKLKDYGIELHNMWCDAYHILDTHKQIVGGWRKENKNRELFIERRKIPIADRIMFDRNNKAKCEFVRLS